MEASNFELKNVSLKNELSIYMMKIVQEGLGVRQELNKIKWKFLTKKCVLLVLFVIYMLLINFF